MNGAAPRAARIGRQALAPAGARGCRDVATRGSWESCLSRGMARQRCASRRQRSDVQAAAMSSIFAGGPVEGVVRLKLASKRTQRHPDRIGLPLGVKSPLVFE